MYWYGDTTLHNGRQLVLSIASRLDRRSPPWKPADADAGHLFRYSIRIFVILRIAYVCEIVYPKELIPLSGAVDY